jgi:hypothetical protein
VNRPVKAFPEFFYENAPIPAKIAIYLPAPSVALLITPSTIAPMLKPGGACLGGNSL